MRRAPRTDRGRPSRDWHLLMTQTDVFCLLFGGEAPAELPAGEASPLETLREFLDRDPAPLRPTRRRLLRAIAGLIGAAAVRASTPDERRSGLAILALDVAMLSGCAKTASALSQLAQALAGDTAAWEQTRAELDVLVSPWREATVCARRPLRDERRDSADRRAARRLSAKARRYQKTWHDAAIEASDLGLLAQRRGEGDVAVAHYREAAGLERAAARLASLLDRSYWPFVLYRSAAVLRLEARDAEGAGRLVSEAIRCCRWRPDEIRRELDQVEVLAVFLAEHVDLSQVDDLAYLQALRAQFRAFDEAETDASDE